MGRVVFFLLLGIAVYVGFRIWQIRNRRGDESASAKRGTTSEPMIRCAKCGLNLPRSEAVAEADRFYCSESHRRLDHENR